MIRLHRYFGLFAAALMLAAAPAGAAPQVLGLLATKVPQPLLCNEAECTADLASFCLQAGRGEPWSGQPYQAAAAAGLSFVATAADGRRFSVPADGLLRIKSNVAMTAVRVFVDRAVLDRLGATRLALQVEPGVSLLPIMPADDPNPLTAAEIAAATGPARALGAAFFEDGAAVGVTARLTAALLSRLPTAGRLSPDQRADLWRDAIDDDLRTASTAEGLGAARRYLDACHRAIDGGEYYTLRTCLEAHHGVLVRARNDELARALQTGW